MTTRPKPTDQRTPPGAVIGVVGTVAAVVGAAISFFNWKTPGYQDGFYFGGMLVIGGLLLRIESAIKQGMSHRHDDPEDGAA